jgi:sirohydrochlorin ferrochelatase
MSLPTLGLTAFGDRRTRWLPAPPGVLPPPRSDVPMLAIAHGTSDAAGLATLEALLERVRFLRPGVETSLAFVSVADPTPQQALADLLAEGATEVVVLPLLLGHGYHVRHDIPRAVRSAMELPGGEALRVYTAPPLGPDPLLAPVLADRLAQVGGPVFGTQIVLAAAGSADRRANADAVAMAGLLAERLGMPVRTAYVTSAQPSISELLGRLARRGRPIAVATYLLSSGEFSRRVADSATLAALDADHPRTLRVGAPLGAHDMVARLVLRRYDTALAKPPTTLNRGVGGNG